jgi:hypothetical protein
MSNDTLVGRRYAERSAANFIREVLTFILCLLSSTSLQL